MVPVSSETYGTSRVSGAPPPDGRGGGGAGGGVVERCPGCCCAAARRAAAVSVTGGRGNAGAAAVCVDLPRTLSHASFSFCFAESHPKVATVNSAHIASVLR